MRAWFVTALETVASPPETRHGFTEKQSTHFPEFWDPCYAQPYQASGVCLLPRLHCVRLAPRLVKAGDQVYVLLEETVPFRLRSGKDVLTEWKA